jgi:multiple sugar transport system permease protein
MSSNVNHPQTTLAAPAAVVAIAGASTDAPALGSQQSKPRKSNLAVHAALIFICVFAIAPFIWLILTSLKTLEATMAYPPTYWPSPIQWHNYVEVFTSEKANFLLWTRNSLVIAVLTVIGTTLSSAIVAYGFAKLRFIGRNFLFGLMLSTMMLPFPVTMVSLFIVFRWLGDHSGMQWIGTFKPLWVPAWFGSAFNIFLLRQFFMTVPNELSEAARIDGCSEFMIFWRIILPLARPALAVVALFAFLAVWGDFLGPLIYLQKPEQFTLALGLQNFQSKAGGTSWHLLMAASALVMLPAILLFFVAQKTFIEGIAMTGTKG